MPSKREQVLSALFDQLHTMALATVKRNEALPQSVPAGGLFILRDGDPGEPDVTLNPVHFYYNHRAEIEAFVPQPPSGGGEAALDILFGDIGIALAADPQPWRPRREPVLERAGDLGARHRRRRADPRGLRHRHPGIPDGRFEPLTITLGEIGLTRLWRAVSFGMLFEDAPVQTAVFSGRDLKPYAPWAVNAVKSGNPANITITWVRRTRIGGEWKGGTGTVPLAEAYEVDILDAPGGVVKRKLASAMPSLTYASADILADFGSVPASLPVVVYQLSAVIGRGFPRAVTLEIP